MLPRFAFCFTEVQSEYGASGACCNSAKLRAGGRGARTRINLWLYRFDFQGKFCLTPNISSPVWGMFLFVTDNWGRDSTVHTLLRLQIDTWAKEFQIERFLVSLKTQSNLSRLSSHMRLWIMKCSRIQGYCHYGFLFLLAVQIFFVTF